MLTRSVLARVLALALAIVFVLAALAIWHPARVAVQMGAFVPVLTPVEVVSQRDQGLDRVRSDKACTAGYGHADSCRGDFVRRGGFTDDPTGYRLVHVAQSVASIWPIRSALSHAASCLTGRVTHP